MSRLAATPTPQVLRAGDPAVGPLHGKGTAATQLFTHMAAGCLYIPFPSFRDFHTDEDGPKEVRNTLEMVACYTTE